MSSAKIEDKLNSPLTMLPAGTMSRDSATGFFARLSPKESQFVLDWNATQHEWFDDCCLHELVEAQVRRTPHAMAIICGESALSYRELDARAHRVAARLLDLGVDPQTPVGVVADCSIDALVGLLGILKAGCAYLPLDTALPSDRLSYFMQDAGVRFVVGQRCALPATTADVTFVSLQDLPAADHVRLPQVSADSLAYVLYTSGSTGKAKGVMLNHRGPVNTIRDVNSRFQIQSTDRVLSLSSLGFDLSVYDLFGMLAIGATIIQPTAAQARDPEQWRQLIHKHAVSVWNTVPALMDMLVTYSQDSSTFPSLRLVMLSGDWIPVALPDRIRKTAPNAQVVSLGGSTEASIWSVLYPIERVDAQWRSIPYGGPMLNQRCYVVDGDMRLCPVGEVGELCLAGIGVALGYLNRTELTAERFLPDPLQADGLMYRTGDLCRYAPDGNLEFLGRSDHQVKIRGYRIGLGEIESEIERLPAVRDAAVIASDEAAGARLIAYVVLHPDQSLTLDELTSQLGQTLPEYMLPGALVKLSALPLSPNGKVDRRQLPLPSIERPASEVQLPSTPTEALVSDILRGLLNLSALDVRDDFYALGGNSLLAVALVCKIQTSCNVQLSVPDVLSKSLNTIELAQRIDAAKSSTQATSVATVESLPCRADTGLRLTRAPLTYAQQQLWVVNFLQQGRQRYNIPLVYDLTGPLNLPALEYAYNQLLSRHDGLRTIYRAQDTRLEQVVLPVVETNIHTIDLRTKAAEERESEFQQQALEFITRPFSLDKEMPIRAALVRLEQDRWRLMFSVHHIAFDGHSINLLQQELSYFYDAYLAGRTDARQPIPYQVANIAQWQHEHLPLNAFDADRQYWRSQLSGPLPVLDLPQDRTTESATEGDTVYRVLDKDVAQAVSQFAKENQSTLFVTLLAAVKAVFHRYSGQEDIVIGTPVSTRVDQTTQDVIGYFINVLPLRTRFEGDKSFRELLHAVRDTVFGALAHQHYPFELLKKEILSSEAAGQEPFRVMLVLEDEPENLQLSGLACRSQLFDTQTAKFDLLIAIFAQGDRIRFEFQYRRDCFDRRRIEAFGQHLQQLLSAAIAKPSQALNRLEWLPREQQSVLTGKSISPTVSFLERWHEQGVATPSAIALAFESQRLTYAEVDERSTALAGYLQQQGITSASRIGIALPRSPEMVIAVLATLKTGAAYVPLDSAWPELRREQVLRDCQPDLLLTPASLAEFTASSSDRNVHTYQPVAIDPETIAYILYTSGSTGQPKGVAMRHAALDNLIAWQLKNSNATAATKTLQFASLGFDVSFQEIFATLCSGGQLHLVKEELQQDLHKLWHFIVDEQIERLFVPFVALRGLAEIALVSPRVAHLKEIVTAGEQLQITDAVQRLFTSLPDCRLWNQYGPTETHVVTAHRLDDNVQTWSSSPVIGLPIDNCSVAILDKQQQPVPCGVAGELYLGGECLAAGYFHQDELTTERFVANPLSQLPGRRLYRTGDLGYVTWDGQLQFVGRNDHQIKVRGHRVELNEVELALMQCPGVKQAIVSLQSCGAGSQLVAHVAASLDSLDVSQVPTTLANTLPAYMIPQKIYVVDEFPKTASGKVDRQRLATRVDDSLNLSSNSTLDDQTDPIIARLRPIWQDVLQLEHVPADANFFECGGDSLAAAILFSRMEAEFGWTVSISKLVALPTLRQLATIYQEGHASSQANWEKLAPLQPRGALTPVICLPGIDGHFLNFRHMTELLGENRPLLGLQPLGLNGVDTPLTDIEAIAAEHMRTLREALPEGPYNLVGFSFGGIVAYEMSQMLRRAGQQVSLSLIDCSTGLPQSPAPLQTLLFHWRYARQLTGARRWHYLAQRVWGLWLAIQYKLKWITLEQRLEGLIDVKGIYSLVAATNMRALEKYRPSQAEGSAVLYRAKLRANWPGPDRTDPAGTWRPLFEGQSFDVVDVDGAHGNMLSHPHVESLVEHLRARLL